MLNTINGFDLLLIIIIVIAGFKIYNLNRECESYVGQIMNVSWELQDWKRSSQLLSKELREANETLYPALPECLYCLGIEEFITGEECYCASL